MDIFIACKLAIIEHSKSKHVSIMMAHASQKERICKIRTLNQRNPQLALLLQSSDQRVCEHDILSSMHSNHQPHLNCEQCLQCTTSEIVPKNVKCDLQTTACIGNGIGTGMHRHRHRHRHQHASASALACIGIGIGISMHRHVQQHASASASACIGTCIGMHRHRHRHRHTCSRRGMEV